MSTRRPATQRRAATRRATPLLASMLLLTACAPGPTSAPTATAPGATPTPATSTPSPSAPPAAEVYAGIRSGVEAIRGLQPSADVDPVTIDEAQLRTNLAAEFDADNKPDQLRFTEESLILLGLLPAGSSLRDLTLDFQGSQVAGYYSPDKKQLFVVSRSGGVGAAEKVTYAHEFTHQLQDQTFPLLGLLENAAGHSDAALAQLSLIEGDAVSVQNRWTTANLTPEEMGQLLTASLDPKAIEALQRAPAYLRETSLFPYLSGNPFVESLMTTGGGYKPVNDAFAKPPASTEQVLHPEKYATREAPIEVKLPARLAAKMGAGWTEAGQDTLGEAILGMWLTEHGVSGPAPLQACLPSLLACAASAGWGGDRLVLLRGPSGDLAVGLVSQWDTVGDAAEFATAAQTAVASLVPGHTVRHKSASKTVILAIGEAAARLADALGG